MRRKSVGISTGLLKSCYVAMKTLMMVSGFGWDQERRMATAETGVWEDYIKVRVITNCMCDFIL